MKGKGKAALKMIEIHIVVTVMSPGYGMVPKLIGRVTSVKSRTIPIVDAAR